MCEPTALTAVAIGATVIATGVTVYGEVQAADAAKAQGNYTAAVARNNAILAQRAADDATARGKQAEANAAMAGKQLIGRQRADLAANGVLVDTGSALDITADTAEQNKLDQLTIRSNAQREALGFETQGMNYTAQAGLDELSSQNIAAADETAAVGSLASGVGSVASKWYAYKNPTPSSPYQVA